MAGRLLKGRNEEGSFETGILNVVFLISKDSRFVPVTGQGSDGSCKEQDISILEQRWYRDNSPFAVLAAKGFSVSQKSLVAHEKVRKLLHKCDTLFVKEA